MLADDVTPAVFAAMSFVLGNLTGTGPLAAAAAVDLAEPSVALWKAARSLTPAAVAESSPSFLADSLPRELIAAEDLGRF